ncbi:MAG: hypothetical protein CMB80_26855 [Flammeovirgaceae bacterium]|mgnify:CR=1 FL=1|nr:hypothetical protein [Flammeovirgaceae bacterium]MBR09652.1 hypothetical protein [Rickettsiales bacterium]HCX22835.1 hypothetical protein [Cytophagales bacterium]|tara:strand:- start:51 stop:428 length:378 start_codon:yes stop_codon:yes gene_type:complete
MIHNVENDYAKFHIKDGILHFVYKRDVELDLEGAKKVVADRIKAQGDQSYPVICDVRSVKTINKEARDYLAKQGSQQVEAVALIVGSPARKVMSNFYLAVNKPEVPTRLFISETEALDYLSELKS